ncbi:MAG: HesA/MoeB/ThiF family protein [Thermoproteota archaeon]
MVNLVERNIERYARQIILQNIGFEGQERIFKSKICLVGMGGLGCPVSLQLVSMGVGYLRIVDRDIVSLTDLHRQYLYTPKDVGKTKVEVAYERLKDINPEVNIDPYPVAVTDYNVEDLVNDCDFVIDCTDSIKARYLLNRVSLKKGIPYIYGAAIENQGSAFTVLPGKTACLECIYPGLTDDELPKCAVVGVNPPVLSMVASIQVSEAIGIITGKEPLLAGKILLIDLQNLIFDTLNLRRSESCEACGKYPNVELIEHSERFEIGCAREGQGIFYLYPSYKVRLDLDKMYDKLNLEGHKGVKRNKFSIQFEPEKGIKLNITEQGFCVAQVDFNLAKEAGLEYKLIDIYKKFIK